MPNPPFRVFVRYEDAITRRIVNDSAVTSAPTPDQAARSVRAQFKDRAYDQMVEVKKTKKVRD